VKKHESQIGELDKLKLKAVVLHDGISKEISASWVRCCRFDFCWLSSVELVWMNYVWLDSVRHGYIGV